MNLKIFPRFVGMGFGFLFILVDIVLCKDAARAVGVVNLLRHMMKL